MSGGVADWVRALVAFGLLLELGVLLVLLGLWVRERAALARFVRDGITEAELKEGVNRVYAGLKAYLQQSKAA